MDDPLVQFLHFIVHNKPPAVKCHVFISVNYRARLDEWNDPSGACASCTLWLLILLPLLPGDSDLVELDGGAS